MSYKTLFLRALDIWGIASLCSSSVCSSATSEAIWLVTYCLRRVPAGKSEECKAVHGNILHIETLLIVEICANSAKKSMQACWKRSCVRFAARGGTGLDRL